VLSQSVLVAPSKLSNEKKSQRGNRHFREPNRIDMAYIAGIFDGEGHIGFYTYKASKNGKRYARLVVGITNSYRPVLEWLCEVIGAGRIQRKRIHSERWKACYSFIIQGLPARTFLVAMLPFLRVKRERAMFVLAQRTYGRIQ